MLDTLIVSGIIRVCLFGIVHFRMQHNFLGAIFLRMNIRNHQSLFAKKLCLFDAVTLKYLNVRGVKVRKFQSIEEKLDNIIQAHEKSFIKKNVVCPGFISNRKHHSLLRR